MQLDLIITQLRARCDVFDQRVAGAAEFKPIPEGTALAVPAAYVIPLDDSPSEKKAQNGYYQDLADGFAVVIVLDNTTDPRGQAAYASVHTVRAEIWRALLGWSPSDDYDPIEYQGGHLLLMDRARMYYQLEFAATTAIDASDTWISVRDAELPAFVGVDMKTDAIDPADPNLQKPGPDGRNEFVSKIDVPQEE